MYAVTEHLRRSISEVIDTSYTRISLIVCISAVRYEPSRTLFKLVGRDGIAFVAGAADSFLFCFFLARQAVSDIWDSEGPAEGHIRDTESSMANG